MAENAEDEELVLTITRGEYAALVDALKNAEELCSKLRVCELDLRMQRLRLEGALKSESATPERRDTTRFVSLGDLKDLADALEKG